MADTEHSLSRPSGDDDDPGIRLDFSFQAVVTQIDPAVRRVMAVLAASQCRIADAADIELVLHEAFANAVIHGSHQNPTMRVEVSVACTNAAGLSIIVRDQGAGFDPTRVPSPVQGDNVLSHGGRGVFLIEKLMDEVSYHRGGSEIRMRKK